MVRWSTYPGPTFSLVYATPLLQYQAQFDRNPALIMKSDLSTLSRINIINKYADEINILVQQYRDVDITAEFENIQWWAASKLSRLCFAARSRFIDTFVPSIDAVELVGHVEILGVIVQKHALVI